MLGYVDNRFVACLIAECGIGLRESMLIGLLVDTIKNILKLK